MNLWVRLKWLADVAALLASGSLDHEQLYRSSLALGAGRCGGLGLILCNLFFCTAVPASLLAELRGDRGLLLLERSTIAAMGRCETQADGTESAWQMLSIIFSTFVMKRGWRYRAAELRFRLFFPYGPRHLAVWPWLWPILSLLEFPRFVLKRMRLRRLDRSLSA